MPAARMASRMPWPVGSSRSCELPRSDRVGRSLRTPSPARRTSSLPTLSAPADGRRNDAEGPSYRGKLNVRPRRPDAKVRRGKPASVDANRSTHSKRDRRCRSTGYFHQPGRRLAGAPRPPPGKRKPHHWHSGPRCTLDSAFKGDTCKCLVRKGRLELPRPLGHQILSLARLPVPPLSLASEASRGRGEGGRG